MTKSLKSILALVVLANTFAFAQFQDPNHYYLTGVKVNYDNYLRDSTANLSWAGGPDTTVSAIWDAGYVTKLQAHYPSKAFAQAGLGFSRDLVVADSLGHHFNTIETDDSLLVTESLETYGVRLHIQLNTDNALIPPSAAYTSTYPTFRDTLCITLPTVPTVDDDPDLAFTGPEEGTDTDMYGWGITNSDVFDWFEALAYNSTTAELDTPGSLTAPANWGMIEAFVDPASGTDYDSLEFVWYALDGRWQDGGADSGYDDDPTSADFGKLDRILGVRLTGDTSTIAATAAALTFMQTYGLADSTIPPINVSNTYPMLNGKGQATDADGDGDNDDIILPTLLGGSLTHAYLFDPAGDDGELFSGDEPLQFTGYYFTKNFLTAFAVATDYWDPDSADLTTWVGYYMALGLDQGSATIAAADTLAWITAHDICLALGVDPTIAGLIPDSVISLGEDLTAYVMAGGTDIAGMIGELGAAVPVQALGFITGMYAAGYTTVNVNDSDHDSAPDASTGAYSDGRLVFELDDSPVCFPVFQTRMVEGTFVKYSLLEVDSDLSNVPLKFAVHNNYPNPFNPVTTIRFDLPEANRTKVTVWNILGQHVNTLYVGDLQAGTHTIHFNGRDRTGQELASGMYFYKVESGLHQATKKMMLLK